MPSSSPRRGCTPRRSAMSVALDVVRGRDVEMGEACTRCRTTLDRALM